MPLTCTSQARVLNALRQNAGGITSVSSIIEYVWPLADVEPDYAYNCVKCAVWRLRARGFPIKTHHGRGYSFVPRYWEVSDVSAS